MKTVLMVLVNLALSIACMAQLRMIQPYIYEQNEDYSDREILRGKVKTIRYFKYTIADTVDSRSKTLAFNNNSFWVDSFSPSGQRLIRYEVKDGKVLWVDSIIYKFDTAGRIVEKKFGYRVEGEIWRIIFQYDKVGNLIRESHYDIEGKLLESFKYSYVAKCIELKQNIEKPDIKTIYQYSDSSKTIVQTNHHCCGERSSVIKYILDSNGNKISEKWLSSSVDSMTFKYDQYDNPILLQSYTPDGKISESYTIKYVYDKQGNWVKKIEDMHIDLHTFNFTRRQEITIRDLTYY